MKSSKPYKTKTGKNRIRKVREPHNRYRKEDSNKTIHFFSSFEEMNEYDIKEMSSHTFTERLQNVTAMIMGMYRSELAKPMLLTIHFKKDDADTD